MPQHSNLPEPDEKSCGLVVAEQAEVSQLLNYGV